MYSALQPYLLPDQIALLQETGYLPYTLRSKLGDELRHEQASCIAYMPSRLVRRQLADPQPGRVCGEFWHGSLLFADLSGFTAFCDKLSVLGKQGAEEVSAIINQVFNGLVAEVFAYHGELLKFGGDALTAFFDAQILGDAHATAATLAALEMQRRMAAFALVETRGGTFQLGLRVGVHSGQVLAAEVGDSSHIELVVTGEEVSRVAQAQGVATPGEVVITHQTATLLEGASTVPKNDFFSQVISLPPTTLPAVTVPVLTKRGNDLDSLEILAQQVEALRPYLVRGLPRRFVESSAGEIGEFRPVSVLFANFYPFTMLLDLLGDDAMQAATVLNTYFCHAQEMVHMYDGIINKVDMYTQGDKLMALFGAPVAHEDDPLRAVRCGLELATMLDEVNQEIASMLNAHSQAHTSPIPPLNQRIGINTGTVFAGRLGGRERYEYSVMGPAVNLSSRLMEHAREGTILLSPNTQTAVERFIIIAEETPVHLKGLAEPIVPVVALGEDFVPRSHSQTGLATPPLIGREDELMRLINQARDGLASPGQVLMLVGEMGLGKTRLIEEFVQRLVMGSINQAADEAIPCFQLYTGDGQSFKQNIPYITLRTPLSQLIGFTQRQSKRANGQTSQVVEQHIQERIGQLVPELAHFTPLVGDVLGITLTETAITRALSAEQRHSRVQELVVALFRQAASEEPLLLVIDDFQWSDTASREILLRLAQITQNSPLVLVLSYRPETAIAEPWADLPNTGREVLQELTQDESWLLVEAMLQAPPPDTLNHLLLRTQGNPFFIEELVRALVASGVLFQHTDERWFLASIPDQVSIPTSIEGMIMERLDRLEEPYYALVQIASVIGNRFQLPILQGVYPNTALLQQGLQYLCDIGILDKEEQPQETTYIFHHALLHEVAYEGILYAQRRELHRQVARCIKSLNSESVDEHLMLLAHHYRLAEDWTSAFHYHLSAGVQAQQRYANHEALMLFNTALEIGHKLEQDMQERKDRADAQIARARDRRHGPADRRRTEVPRKMVASCREAHVWDGRHWIVDRRSGPADRRMVEWARRGKLRKTPQEPISPYMLNLAEVYERRGDMYILMGEYVQAQEALHQALVLLKRWKAAELQQQETESPTHDMGYKRKFALMWVRLHRLLAWVLEYRAEYDEAFTWLQQGIQEASPDTREELARCYVLGASIFHQRGEYDHSLEWARLGLQVAKELGNAADQAHALLLMGNLWRDQGEFDTSIPVLEQACALLDEMKDATRLGEALQSLGDAYWSVGRWQDALKYYQQSLQMSENIGDVMGQAYASNRLARVMVGRGELEMAYELYKYSGEQFRRVGSLPGLAITGYHHGEVILRKGQARDALHLLRVSISSLERIKARNVLPEVLRLAAEATLELGDCEEATDYLSQALIIASDMGMVAEEAIAWRVMGQIVLHEGDVETAAEHLEHGRSLLEKINNRYELGKVQYWQAKVAIARGNVAVARELAEQAQTIFQGLRAKRDLQMVKTLLTEVSTTNYNNQYAKKTMV